MENSRKNLPATPMTLDDVQQAIGELRTFVARRFDEVSFEVNATGQMLGMTEEAMSTRFTEVMAILNAVSFKGDGTTPHNVGVELEAVVKTTEDAANKILDAATVISDLTKQPVDWNDAAAREKFLAGINNQTDTILAACAFQDLTGQRIGRTLENIRKAEADLADTLKQMGLKIEVSAAKTAEALGGTQRAGSQADIDALFR
jgi:chemotaxis protein CheZ